MVNIFKQLFYCIEDIVDLFCKKVLAEVRFFNYNHRVLSELCSESICASQDFPYKLNTTHTCL